MDKFVTKSKRKNSVEEPEEKDTKKQKAEEKTNKGKEEESIEKSSSSSFFDEKLSVRQVFAMVPDTSDKECQEFFPKLGDFILNELVLVAGGKKHAIREIEFYWNTKNHNDIFTHGGKVQESCGYWYFHKTGNNYRSGSYKGLDISFGKGEHSVGGALIRSLEVLDNTGKFICGPSLSVDHILSMCNAESIQDLVDNHMKGNISVEKDEVAPTKSPKKKAASDDEEDEEEKKPATKPLYLERVKPGTGRPKEEVMKSARVGLHPTKGASTLNIQFNYVYRFYRFFAKPAKIPKGKNLMILALHHEGKKPDEIARKTNAQAKTVTKTIELYEKGKTMKPETFGKKLTDDEVCQAHGAILNMKQ